jgi:hypothetical protein
VSPTCVIWNVLRLTLLSVEESIQECTEACSKVNEFMWTQDEGTGSSKSQLSESHQSLLGVPKDEAYSQDEAK